MSGINENPYIGRFIGDKLKANSALVALLGGPKIFPNKAPEGVPHPFIVYDVPMSRDVLGVGQARVMTVVPCTVKVIGKAVDDDPPYDIMVQAANLIDASLDQSSGSVDGKVHVGDCTRIKTIAYQDDHEFEHLGGIYEINAYTL